MIIPANCISVYKEELALKNLQPPSKGKEHICDNLKPVCQQGNCTTEFIKN
ncbi:MAG: hypothetical protein UV63_C0020G0002 [Microgenomates group bacterium GW2011_GWC1_43_11]|nr:MAG: hypothetical protein UV63_C0020G0002 [Microgenomates group bacterium GW2011_GWC1_43_11]